MRQVVIPRIGGPEVLELREAPDPVPGPGEVRIRVAASGVNFADVLARIGLYPGAPPLPAVVGYEISGTIDAVGEGVTDVHQGDRVFAACRFGGYTDVITVPSEQVLPLPPTASFAEGAAVPVNYVTAWLMLVELGNLSAYHTVLVHSAGGGVGQAALQICRLRGATVIGVASASKHERLRENGVQVVIDPRRDDLPAMVKQATDGRGVDIVLDGVGGRTLRQSYDLLAPLGRVFTFGVSSFVPGRSRNLLAVVSALLRTPRFAPLDLMSKNRGVFGFNLGHLWQEKELLRGALGQIGRHFAAGELRPVVDIEVPFAEAPRAHARLQQRENFGKVLLVP